MSDLEEILQEMLENSQGDYFYDEAMPKWCARIRAVSYTWQPIETAPRDGAKVLICQAEGEYFCAQVAYWDRGEADWMIDIRLPATGCGDPTHWMPLPAPQKPSKTTPELT